MNSDKRRILELEQRVAELEQLVLKLYEIIESQARELAYYRNAKNSGNSSVPPSQDPFRIKRTESLRESTGKKRGGQPGHKGETLEMVDHPDQVIEHKPRYCSECGQDLSSYSSDFVGKRQLIDLPNIAPVITEHRVYLTKCRCGHSTASAYPSTVHSPVCYGENITALSAYFHARQYIPYERMQEMFKDVFGVRVSQGTLVKMQKTFAGKSGGIYEQIRCRVERSSLVGGDETGVCINGHNQWAWAFQNDKNTYIRVHASRGKKAIDDIFPRGFAQATVVHDCWKPYFITNCQSHQICTAHLLRELKYLEKLYPGENWTSSFKSLLLEAIELKKQLTPTDYYHTNEKCQTIEEHLAKLLQYQVDPKYQKLHAFKDRIVKYQDFLLQFLYRHDIPPDNNSSERTMRTFKVKQKVSGLFRSKEGAEHFAIIRSIIDTTIKNSKNVLEALALIAKLEAE